MSDPPGAIKIASSSLFSRPSEDWLAHNVEPILDPARRIVDTHHHLFDRHGWKYLIDEYHADIATGHNVVGSVYVDCVSMYRLDGPKHLRSVGEVEYVNGCAAMSASGYFGATRMCAGIVGFGGLHNGDLARETMEASIAAGNGRLRGVRHMTSWDADADIHTPVRGRKQHMLADETFRQGFAHLAPLGLSFDAFIFHPQLPDLVDLARAFPDTTIILDHLGGPVGIGRYADRRAEVLAEWTASMTALAACPNVSVKLGGLGMSFTGFGFDFARRATPASSGELAAAWRPYVETAIELFGPERCMFESNFNPDKASCSYATLWNAFKRIAAQYGDAEQDRLFSGTAIHVYRLPELAL